MAVLLKETIKPNLVQTLEGQPAFVHCGPFANIAHGNNSVVADRVALKLGDYVVTESGFGSDMGMEKFFDIVCRLGNLRPDAVVLVATVKALKHHAGDPDGGIEAIEVGAANLTRHLGIVREFGLNAVVAVNRFPGDTTDEIELVRGSRSSTAPTRPRSTTASRRAAQAAAALAEAVVAAADEPSQFDFLYPLDAPIEDKIEAIAKRVYGADGISLLPAARAKIKEFNEAGLDQPADLHGEDAPLALARPALANAPTGFTVGVRDLRAYTGRRLDRRALRRHADDARPRQDARRVRTSTSTSAGRRLASSNGIEQSRGDAAPLIRAEGVWKIFGTQRRQGDRHARRRSLPRASCARRPAASPPCATSRSTSGPGEVFVVMGLSGSGKSTLVRTLIRLIEPTAGRSRSTGSDVTAAEPRRAAPAAPPHVVDGLPALRPARPPAA